MGKSNNTQDKPKKTKQYQKIECDQRKQVLDMLLNQKLSLQEVANKLSLKYCTVRTIQKTFERDGRIGKKESRKKKMRVESVLKISVLNPLTMQIQPISVQSDIHQIYVDKQPSLLDQITLANQQQSLLQTQCSNFTQALISYMNEPNLIYQSTIQNMLLSSQHVFKSILELKPQGQIKQEFNTLSQPRTQFSYIQQPYQYQYCPLPYPQIRT